MRPSWDEFFIGLAEYISRRSKDPSTQTGAVIVRPDKTIASVGYNGFPRGTEDNEEEYCDRDKKYSKIIHCEMNAILNAKEPLNDYTLYTWPFMSCDRCATHVIQAGIKRCVAPKASEELLARWDKSLSRSKQYFKEASVELVILNV